MSLISDALAAGLAALATAKGDALSYATSVGGTYTALTGWVIHPQPSIPGYSHDDERHLETQTELAIAKGPLSPVIATGYYLKDTANGDRVWYVESVATDLQQIVNLRRITQGDATTNRKARS